MPGDSHQAVYFFCVPSQRHQSEMSSDARLITTTCSCQGREKALCKDASHETHHQPLANASLRALVLRIARYE